MDRPLGRGPGPPAPSPGVAVPERRRQADRPVDGPRRGPCGAAAPTPAEHPALGEVHRHRPRGGRRPGRARRRPGGGSLQADQLEPVPQRLPRVRLPLHARRHHATRPPGARREVPGPLERHPLARRVGRPPVPGQHLVHSVRDHPEPREGPSAPGHVPAETPRVLPPPAWGRTGRRGRRPVPGARVDDGRVCPARRRRPRHRTRRTLPPRGIARTRAAVPAAAPRSRRSTAV